MKLTKSVLPKLFLMLGWGLLGACHYEEQEIAQQVEGLNLEPLPKVQHPENNQPNPAKKELGRLLFWDPILSGGKEVSCATCHHPKHGYADGLSQSIGVGGEGLGQHRQETRPEIPRVGRNSPTVLNAAYNGLLNSGETYDPLAAPMFWDGRVRSLESQALRPPTSFNEMRGTAYTEEATYDSLLARLRTIPEYRQRFAEAFPGSQETISKAHIGKAIASFERTLVARNAPYDRYLRGQKEALSEEQLRGMELFFGKANCASCHSGPMFSDYNYYKLAVEASELTGLDSGRNNAFRFRTPTLRNITETAPYMHNGQHETLREVMNYYNKGKAEQKGIGNVHPKIKPLNLSEKEMTDIIAFLRSLTDPDYDRQIPQQVPSGLPVGGAIR